MFNRLPESNAQRQKRGGGFAVSTLLHLVLIALAVRATAGTATQVEPVATQTPFFVEPPTEVPRRAARPPVSDPTPSATSVGPAPSELPAIDAIDIPTTIPEPGAMGPIIRNDDFRTSGTLGVTTGGDGTRPNVSDGSPLEERYVDRPVVAMPGTGPRYPSGLQGAGVEGDVRARFVVDTLGRVEPGSVRILEAAHDLFSQAVRDALTRARFVPAEAGGRKVRQLVEQPFSFKLTGR